MTRSYLQETTMLELLLTQTKYDYSPNSLSMGSSKEIVVRCDYCNSVVVKKYKDYCKQRSSIDKDSCGNTKCKYKKRTEISEALYNCSNSAQREEVKEKIRQKNTKRLQSEDFKKEAKITNMAKYGSENAMRSQSIKDKQKITLQNKYGVDNIMKYADTAKIAAQKMRQTKITNGTILVYDGKTRPEIAEEIGFSRSHFGKLVVKYGLEEAMKMTPKQSSLEKQFKDILQEQNIKYDTQFRVSGKIADFRIEDLLIETDGLYWHSDAAKLDKDYHIDKKIAYTNAGYTSLFFREDEIRDKAKIVKSILLHKLNKSIRVFARKCSITILSNKEADLFFEQNHLMGKGRGTCFALKIEDKILAGLRMKRIKKDEYEISRFCCLNNHNVIGGFSKLLKHSINELKPSNIITFIDQRYSNNTANYLIELGFKYIHTYPSFKWTDGYQVFHRLKFPKNTGYEKGLFKIWDCGQAKWSLPI